MLLTARSMCLFKGGGRWAVRRMRAAAVGGGGGGGALLPLLHPSHPHHAANNNKRLLLVHTTAAAATPAAATTPFPPADSRQLLVLGIESSCDDTAAAVVTGDGRVLGEACVGQADLLAKYGGVHPSAAAAAHAAAIDGVVDAALAAAGVAGRDVSAVAFTLGPGLSLCLNVGVRKARSLSRALGAPLVPVHHMEAHALVARMPAAVAAAAATTADGAGVSSSNSSSNGNTASSQSSSAAAAAPAPAASAPQFPFLVLLVSGGHNLLLLARGVGEYVQLGSTLDDALGEAYDKVARMLGLVAAPHGGAALEALARRGDSLRYPLPVPMKRRANCDFSFAGLKTSARMCIERELAPLEEGTPGREQAAADIAASFQVAAATHVAERVARGIGWARDMLDGTDTGSGTSGSSSGSGSSNGAALKQLVVAGGVAANAYLRARLAAVAHSAGLELVAPPPRWCTDNGVMVAWAGVERLRLGLYEPPPPPLSSSAPAAAASGDSQDPQQQQQQQQEEWVELRPRWPLASEKHVGGTPAVRSGKSPAKQARSLSDETREALEAIAAAGGGGGGAPQAAAAAQ